MIKAIVITNHVGDSIELNLEKPDHGLIITKIEGLGPVKANINTNTIASNDGAIFNSARAETRNIKVSFSFVENPTIEATRQLTYRYFPLKKRIRFMVVTDTRVVYTYGYVESNEPDIFQSRETTAISIICPDPYFYSFNVNATVFAGVEPKFELPFSNESTTENLTEVSELIRETVKPIYYNGDADIGVLMTIHVIGEVPDDIVIYNSQTKQQIKIDVSALETLTGAKLKYGDDILVSTVKNEKYVRLLRDGKYTNILNAMDRDSEWIYLTTGDNIFIYDAGDGTKNLQFKVENQVMYEGI